MYVTLCVEIHMLSHSKMFTDVGPLGVPLLQGNTEEG